MAPKMYEYECAECGTLLYSPVAYGDTIFYDPAQHRILCSEHSNVAVGTFFEYRDGYRSSSKPKLPVHPRFEPKWRYAA